MSTIFTASLPLSTDPAPRWRMACSFAAGLLPWALLLSRTVAELLVAVIAVGYLWGYLWRHYRNPRLDGLAWGILALWLWLNLVVSPMALIPDDSFSRSIGWVRFVLLFLALRDWLVRDTSDLRFFALAWGSCLGFVWIDAVWQLLTGVSISGQEVQGKRLTGALDRPNIGSFLARIGLPLLALGVALSAGRPAALLRTALAAALITALIVLTGERSAAILTVACLILALLLSALSSPEARRVSLAALIALVLIVFLLLLLSPHIQGRMAETLTTLSHFADSAYGRLMHAGIVMGSDHPWTGVGLKNFRSECPVLFEAARVLECSTHPHNFYVEWFAESGWPGLLAFTAIACAMLRESWQATGPASRSVRPWCLVAALMVLFPLQASQSFFSNWPGLLAWSSLGLTLAVARVARSARADAAPGA